MINSILAFLRLVMKVSHSLSVLNGPSGGCGVAARFVVFGGWLVCWAGDRSY